MAFNYSPKISTDGLVLCLDAANTKSYSGSGTVWSDLSRGGNNGTLTNGPTFNSGNGGSIVFDGVNDYVDCGVSNISLPINITLISWIYQSTTTGYRNIITKEGATFTDLDYGFTTSPNGNLYFWFHNGSYRIHETLTNNITLSAKKCSIFVASKVARHAKAKHKTPVSNTGRLPMRSDSGPNSHCSKTPPNI